MWEKFRKAHPSLAEFLMFFIICIGVTILQLLLMPFFKWIFGNTVLVDTTFQVFQVGQNLNGTPYYIFDYAAGSIASGGGGGLAYFLAVELTMAIAQVINFFAQRNVTFKACGNVWHAALWYLAAYQIITVGAAALQGFYKVPVYRFLIEWLGNGAGTTAADIVTMLINCTLSFWVFYPVMKWIFKK